MTDPHEEAAEADLRAALDAGDPAHIEVASNVVDRLDARRPAPSLHSVALWYAENGLRAFPLQPGTKVPMRGSRGFKDATCDPERINDWWRATPDANIGLATGHLIDVVDIDGAKGQKSRAEMWESTFARIDAEALAKALTPRPGGMHIYVPATGDRSGAALAPGVDYRGIGGYVVAPSSRTEIGSYRFLGDASALTTLAGEASA